MIDQYGPKSQTHVNDLIVEYLEERLSPMDKTAVENHLKGCPQCLSKAEDLRNIITALGKNRTVFCPHPRELFGLARSGRNPDPSLEEHLKDCSTCREELRTYRSSENAEIMSKGLWEKVQERLAGTEQSDRVTGRPGPMSESLGDRVSSWFKVPVLTVGVVAAAILLLVFLYPSEVPPTAVGLSSITWEKVPKPKATLQGGQERAAFLVYFTDFKKPLPQQKIDSVYRALEPTMDLIERYQVVPPSLVREAVLEKQVKLKDSKILLEDLRNNLSVTVAVVVIVSQLQDSLNIECQMIDTATGDILRSNAQKVTTQDDLASAIRKNVAALMLQPVTPGT